jgi:hypothetical protein
MDNYGNIDLWKKKTFRKLDSKGFGIVTLYDTKESAISNLKVIF